MNRERVLSAGQRDRGRRSQTTGLRSLHGGYPADHDRMDDRAAGPNDDHSAAADPSDGRNRAAGPNDDHSAAADPSDGRNRAAGPNDDRSGAAGPSDDRSPQADPNEQSDDRSRAAGPNADRSPRAGPNEQSDDRSRAADPNADRSPRAGPNEQSDDRSRAAGPNADRSPRAGPNEQSDDRSRAADPNADRSPRAGPNEQSDDRSRAADPSDGRSRAAGPNDDHSAAAGPSDDRSPRAGPHETSDDRSPADPNETSDDRSPAEPSDRTPAAADHRNGAMDPSGRAANPNGVPSTALAPVRGPTESPALVGADADPVVAIGPPAAVHFGRVDTLPRDDEDARLGATSDRRPQPTAARDASRAAAPGSQEAEARQTPGPPTEAWLGRPADRVRLAAAVRRRGSAGAVRPVALDAPRGRSLRAAAKVLGAEARCPSGPPTPARPAAAESGRGAPRRS